MTKRGDRNGLNSLSDRDIIKLQSPIRSNVAKYSPVPAFVSLSTPEPFSYKPTTSITQRPTRPTTVISTIPSTTSTTTQRPAEPDYYTTR